MQLSTHSARTAAREEAAFRMRTALLAAAATSMLVAAALVGMADGFPLPAAAAALLQGPLIEGPLIEVGDLLGDTQIGQFQ